MTDSSRSSEAGADHGDGSPAATQYLIQGGGIYASDDRIDLVGIVRTLWSRKWTIFIVTVLAIAVSVAYALTAREWFQAKVLLAPASTDSGQGIPLNIPGLGSLAGLAGLGTSAPGTAEPLAVLASRDFIEEFIEGEGLLSQITDARKSFIRRAVDPDLDEAVLFFIDDVLSISEDDERGMVSIAIEWIDPQIAAAWANLLVERLNETMRRRALSDAEANIDVLKRELAISNQVPLQQAIGRLFESELQKAMLARVKSEFAFRVIDDADAPKRRSKPLRRQVVLFSTIIGFFTACIFVLMGTALRGSRATGSK